MSFLADHVVGEPHVDPVLVSVPVAVEVSV